MNSIMPRIGCQAYFMANKLATFPKGIPASSKNIFLRIWKKKAFPNYGPDCILSAPQFPNQYHNFVEVGHFAGINGVLRRGIDWENKFPSSTLEKTEHLFTLFLTQLGSEIPYSNFDELDKQWLQALSGVDLNDYELGRYVEYRADMLHKTVALTEKVSQEVFKNSPFQFAVLLDIEGHSEKGCGNLSIRFNDPSDINSPRLLKFQSSGPQWCRNVLDRLGVDLYQRLDWALQEHSCCFKATELFVKENREKFVAHVGTAGPS